MGCASEARQQLVLRYPGVMLRPSTNSVGVLVTPARMPERKSRFTALRDRVGAAVGLERSRSRPESLGTLPQVGVVQVALVGVERVVELPEAPLQRGGLRRAGQHLARAGAWTRPGSGGRPA